ncbi:Ribosomal RNA small subunit methyltransferase I [Bienertia sinuspersici]
MAAMLRLLPPWMTISATSSPIFRCNSHFTHSISTSLSFRYSKHAVVSFCSNSLVSSSSESDTLDFTLSQPSKQGNLKAGLALRVLKSADVILSEDTRHSGKLLHYYGIKTPLISYHKFNEFQRERTILKRLQQGEIVALISDAGMPGISDPGTELVKLCVEENIIVFPIPGPSAVIAALSASGLPTDDFTFVGFLPKHARSRREKLVLCANQITTQIFFVPPHKLNQFLEETSTVFGNSRRCVIAREMTKIHEEFWRGTLQEAKEAFLSRQPRGEMTLLIEGKAKCIDEPPQDSQIEDELRELITSGQSLSMAVKLVAEGTSREKKEVYSIALRKFGKQVEGEE